MFLFKYQNYSFQPAAYHVTENNLNKRNWCRPQLLVWQRRLEDGCRQIFDAMYQHLHCRKGGRFHISPNVRPPFFVGEALALSCTHRPCPLLFLPSSLNLVNSADNNVLEYVNLWNSNRRCHICHSVSPALQYRALDQCPQSARTICNTVWVPAGSYYLNSQLPFYRKIRICPWSDGRPIMYTF
jgi:hypothetical protein